MSDRHVYRVETDRKHRQNNSRLDELASKVSALRGVTIDIYDNARDQSVIDSTVRSSISYMFLFILSV
jgi:blocked-early-in-transport protein 1